MECGSATAAPNDLVAPYKPPLAPSQKIAAGAALPHNDMGYPSR